MRVPDLRNDDKSAKDTGTADFETALEYTKFGKFHIALIIIGGFCYLATGFEYGLHAYIFPFAQCDLEITPSQMGIINALFLGGSIICSFVWGVVADTVGRRKVLILSMFLDGVSTVIASFSTSFYIFAAVRFVSGFMIGAPGCLATSYVGEFCVNRHRTRAICTIGFCWTFAWMLLPGVAWLIIPTSFFHFVTPFMEYHSWRAFVFFIGMPPIIAAFLLYFLPETPKFLFIQGRESEAIAVLQKIFRSNTGRSEDEYPVMRLVSTYSSDATPRAPTADGLEPAKKGKSFGEVCSGMVYQTKEVFTPPHLQKAILCSSIYFANFFGYYGLGLWLPELFNRFEAFYAQHPNESITVCELSQLNSYSNSSFSDDEASMQDMLNGCGERTINLGVFINTFIIGAVTCIGNMLAIVLSNRVGGRILSVVAGLLAGVSAIAVYSMQTMVAIVAVNCLFMMGIGTAMVTLSSCAVNLYPTSIRYVFRRISLLF
ncbi:UNVERIFIED_CONTAM: hypothetical protein PYX00_009343 [Menopon gallinae]|uniref:Major facilitator superfamily (MFS) profile domain-containing protein n=1 Tax=Menopon gallinae TaxID=328185 RepID=A0AAW2HAP2_9NEOP